MKNVKDLKRSRKLKMHLSIHLILPNLNAPPTRFSARHILQAESATECLSCRSFPHALCPGLGRVRWLVCKVPLQNKTLCSDSSGVWNEFLTSHLFPGFYLTNLTFAGSSEEMGRIKMKLLVSLSHTPCPRFWEYSWRMQSASNLDQPQRECNVTAAATAVTDFCLVDS